MSDWIGVGDLCYLDDLSDVFPRVITDVTGYKPYTRILVLCRMTGDISLLHSIRLSAIFFFLF